MTVDRRAFLTAATLAALRPLRLDAAGWRAGVATVDITPRQSLWMAGFAARTQPSQGTAQPLHAKALAIVTPGILGPDYFHEVAAILDAAAGGPPDFAALGEVMRRHGITCAA